MEVKMVIAFYKRQGKGGVKKIKVEGGREKEKEVIVRHEIVSSKWKTWNHDKFHVTGTRIIPSRKEK
jgi:hypothetical protein